MSSISTAAIAQLAAKLQETIQIDYRTCLVCVERAIQVNSKNGEPKLSHVFEDAVRLARREKNQWITRN